MKEILFELNPSIVSVFDAFSKSPFFSEDAYACRARYSIQSKLVVPKISEEVVGALHWKLSESVDGNILLIEQVEVVKNYQSRQIGRQLILETERMNQGNYMVSSAYITSPFNFSSLRMLQCSGYTRVTTYKHIKKVTPT